MRDYEVKTFNVPFVLMKPTSKRIEGALMKDFEISDVIYCSFKTFGGSERVINGVWSVEKTGTVDTWFNPHITADCRIRNAVTGAEYEIISEPENIDNHCQFLQFKVRKVTSNA